MDRTSSATLTNGTMQEQEQSQPVDIAGSSISPQDDQTGFGARGRTRRRVRFLRKARELAYRDLGGLVFNLHRFGQRNDPLVVAKLSMLERIDSELRALEASLDERQPVTVLREAGITACPRCAAIHGSEDRFCPNCGLPIGRHADLPIAGSAPGSSPTSPTPATGTPAPSPQPAPQSGSATPASAPAPTAPPVTGEQRSSELAEPHASGAADPSSSAGADEPTEILRPPIIGK